MGIILSHTTALEYWRLSSLPPAAHPYAKHGFDSRFAQHLFKPTKTDVLCFDRNLFSSLNKPIHVLVCNPAHRSKAQGVVCHVCSKPIPLQQILKIAENIYVCSPKLCLTQIALQCPLAQTIAIGFEFCGSYRLRPSTRRGFIDSPPLLSRKEITAVPLWQKRINGSSALGNAATFICEKSASPMETVLVELLCLPASVGGYGLPLPRLNAPITILDPHRKSMIYHADLYWAEAKLAIEYDSKTYHSGSQKIALDAARRNRILGSEISVITVTTDQVMNYERLDALAHLVAKMLGKRLRFRGRDWNQRRFELRKILLS